MGKVFYICNPDDLETTEDQKVRIKPNIKKNLPGLVLSISIIDDDYIDFHKQQLIKEIQSGKFQNILLQITDGIITDFLF